MSPLGESTKPTSYDIIYKVFVRKSCEGQRRGESGKK